MALPNAIEVATAIESRRRLAIFLSSKPAGVSMKLLDPESKATCITLPPLALYYLEEVLRELSSGNGARIVPIRAELTIIEAAELLNVSKPYVTRLINEGRITCAGEGRKRRVRLIDLISHSEEMKVASTAAMLELTMQAEEHDQEIDSQFPYS